MNILKIVVSNKCKFCGRFNNKCCCDILYTLPSDTIVLIGGIRHKYMFGSTCWKYYRMFRFLYSSCPIYKNFGYVTKKWWYNSITERSNTRIILSLSIRFNFVDILRLYERHYDTIHNKIIYRIHCDDKYYKRMGLYHMILKIHMLAEDSNFYYELYKLAYGYNYGELLMSTAANIGVKINIKKNE